MNNAQRLVRAICAGCKRERRLDNQEIEYLQLPLGDYPVWEGEGCIDCRGTGYRGRTGIFEMMELSEPVKAAISNGASLADLTALARAEGMVSLHEAAVRKMLEGITTFEEVVAVTG